MNLEPRARKEAFMYKHFSTELTVRPDDIDMNNHVHMSKYLDYVLHARYDQMERCYGMSMNKFIERGWGWFVKSCSIDYKRALSLGDRVTVETWLDNFNEADVTVRFRILISEKKKVSAEGIFVYTMINLKTNRPEIVPDWVLEVYTGFVE